MSDTRVGLIGCGNVAVKYMDGIALTSGIVVTACADIDPEAARSLASRYAIPRVLGVDELIHDDEVEIVVNLTVPRAHGDVTRAALVAGKSVYSEKPLGLDLEECEQLLEVAAREDVRLASAPDSFLSGGYQTARRALDSGVIGTPAMAIASLHRPGPEAWHPSPEFLYAPGAGPLLDMGPYYVTALVHLLGPVRRVSAIAANPSPVRLIGTGPRKGASFRSAVATEVHAIGDIGAVQFALDLSYDAPAYEVRIDIIGDRGVLRCPDPDYFEGPVLVRDHGSEDWRELPLLEVGMAQGRGFGLAELAAAMREDRPHRTDAALAHHVLEALFAIERSTRERNWVDVRSRVDRPAPLPVQPHVSRTR